MATKIAVVTGGSKGMGREVARGLLVHGYKVAIFGRSRAPLDEAAADLGTGVLALSVDVGDETSVAAGFAKVDEHFGAVDTLINVAGIYHPFPIEDATSERVLPMVYTNFCGPVYCMRQAVQRMKTLGLGDIVNVSSESVRQSAPLLSIYTSTKAALEQMTKLMGEELRGDGIRCTTFRVGRMNSRDAAGEVIPAELIERWVGECQTSGFGHWTGQGMQTASAAAALVNMLLTPRDARVELIEVRSH